MFKGVQREPRPFLYFSSAGELRYQSSLGQPRGIQNRAQVYESQTSGAHPPKVSQSTIANGFLAFLICVCVEIKLYPRWAAQLLLKQFNPLKKKKHS